MPLTKFQIKLSDTNNNNNNNKTWHKLKSRNMEQMCSFWLNTCSINGKSSILWFGHGDRKVLNA